MPCQILNFYNKWESTGRQLLKDRQPPPTHFYFSPMWNNLDTTSAHFVATSKECIDTSTLSNLGVVPNSPAISMSNFFNIRSNSFIVQCDGSIPWERYTIEVFQFLI